MDKKAGEVVAVIPSGRHTAFTPKGPARAVVSQGNAEGQMIKPVLRLAVDADPVAGHMRKPKMQRLELPDYIRWIKRQLCCGYAQTADDPHHIINHGFSGTATKACDLLVTASWRRAINSLEDFERAWVLYCYGGKHTHMNHMLICEYLWLQMHGRLRGRRVTNDMTGNLITLTGIMTWNAGQLMSQRENIEVYTPTYAAQEIGVKASAWSQNYQKHWKFMYDKCAELDHMALEKLIRKI